MSSQDESSQENTSEDATDSPPEPSKIGPRVADIGDKFGAVSAEMELLARDLGTFVMRTVDADGMEQSDPPGLDGQPTDIGGRVATVAETFADISVELSILAEELAELVRQTSEGDDATGLPLHA